MTGMIVPTVAIVDAPMPWWARGAIGRAKWSDQPGCVLAARVTYLWPWILPTPGRWDPVSFVVDSAELVSVSAPPGNLWEAGGLPAGSHVFGVWPGGEKNLVEPVVLDVPRGSVALVVVQPDNYAWLRWMSPRPPSVSYRILPHGFAHNGRWGERWSRRLGWSGQADGAGS